MNKSIKLIVNYVLGPVLFLLLCWSLYHQIVKQPNLSERWNIISQSWKNPLFWAVMVLMFLNWALETLKWQIQTMPLEKLRFSKALYAVLAGCSITMLTPNRIGEYGGRMLFLQEKNRLPAIPLTILGSMAQLAITLLAGTIGLIWLRYFSVAMASQGEMPWFVHDIFLIVGAVSSIVILFGYFRVHTFMVWLLKIPLIKNWANWLMASEKLTRKQLLRILFYSSVRYMVFILQYTLMLHVMDVSLPADPGAWLITQFFLVMAIAPTIGFIELPVRATAGIAIFGTFHDNMLGIQAAVLAIWLINMVLPAISGSLCILNHRKMNQI